MSVLAESITERIEAVQERVAVAAQRSGRDASEVLLVAVTKTHGLEVIEAAYQVGLRHFGENRVEEARDKVLAARKHLPADAVWHMVGHVQSRKTRDVASLFDWVQSVDRFKIARRLKEALEGEGRTLDLLLEVNLSGEESKYGYDLSRWPDDKAQGDAFFSDIEAILPLPGIRLHGLMTLAPYAADPEVVRPVFRKMRLLREALLPRFPGQLLSHLSMGMSGDYEVAIEEGATMVRLGTALFGARLV